MVVVRREARRGEEVKERRRLRRRVRRMLLRGPAKEMMAMSRRGRLRLEAMVSTGLPQPKPKKRRAREPRGSRWAKGLRVRRPLERGLGSPSRSAARA